MQCWSVAVQSVSVPLRLLLQSNKRPTMSVVVDPFVVLIDGPAAWEWSILFAQCFEEDTNKLCKKSGCNCRFSSLLSACNGKHMTSTNDSQNMQSSMFSSSRKMQIFQDLQIAKNLRTSEVYIFLCNKHLSRSYFFFSRKKDWTQNSVQLLLVISCFASSHSFQKLPYILFYDLVKFSLFFYHSLGLLRTQWPLGIVEVNII